MGVRTRSMTKGIFRSTKGFKHPGLVSLNEAVDRRLYSEHQVTISEGHPISLIGKPGGSNIGGPFDTWKIVVETDGETLELSEAPGSFYGRYASGIPVAGTSIFNYLEATHSESAIRAAVPSGMSVSDLRAFGSSAISVTTPTNPVVDGASAFAELVSSVPTAPARSTANIGSVAAGNYLQWQFGIVPTVSDAKSIRETAEQSEKILDQIERDATRLVRRRFDGPATSSSSSFTTGGQYVYFPGVSSDGNLQQPGVLTTTETNSQRTWFSGAFTYSLPRDGTWRRRLEELDLLYGVKPDLNTAWNLLPFSWLADWQSNAGHVINNLNSVITNGAMLQYGYVMCETRRRITYSLQNNVLIRGNMVPRTTTCALEFIRKQRVPGNPFGFGVDLGDLSPKQVAIMAALGFSRT